jgi:meso-butanediol dehydrogenase/(S,S)-butanediol dehydrogenase/diacetyl reductase
MTGARRLEGRRALVTGASTGQGQAVARRFAEEGARLTVSDRPGADLESLVDSLRAAGAQVDLAFADLSDPDQADGLVPAAVSQLGGLDIVYNNAGVFLGGQDAIVGDVPDDIWSRVIEINLGSIMRVCRAAIPALIESPHASIINVSSVAGYAGSLDTTAYPSSKAGVIGLTLSIAHAYGDRGVRANVICPGMIETPMLSVRIEDPPTLAAMLATVSLGRLGRPDEVAGVAAFLASDDASYVTATVLPVHGGMRR